MRTRAPWFLVALLLMASLPAFAAPAPRAARRTEAAAPKAKPRPVPARSKAPGSLVSLRTDARDIGEAARSGDWTRASRLAGRAWTTWTSLKKRVQAAGATSWTLEAMDRALGAVVADVASRNRRAVENNANLLGGTIPDLFDLYVAPSPPTDVMRVEAALRKARAAGRNGDPEAAAEAVGAVESAWTRARLPVTIATVTRVGAPGAETIVEDLDAVVVALRAAVAAKDPARVAAAAEDGLDRLRTVERLFRSPAGRPRKFPA